jgi:hypothetical protein
MHQHKQLSRRASRHGLGRDRRSTAAMEFALIAPVIILLFFAFYDISDAMITYEEVFNAARVISASVSNISVQGENSTTKLYYGQDQLEASTIFGEMPDVRSGFHSGIKSITISSINFEVTDPTCKPGVNCVYDPYVVWSVAYAGPPSKNTGLSFDTPLRGCAAENVSNGTATLDPNSALHQTTPTGGQAGDLTSLRTEYLTTENVKGALNFPAAPDPIIVVDVHYQYVPLFNVFLTKPIDFWADGYWPLRSVQATQVTTNANGTSMLTQVPPDKQYTEIVATPTLSNGLVTSYTILPNQVYPPSTSGTTQAATTTNGPTIGPYCISTYYTEPET